MSLEHSPARRRRRAPQPPVPAVAVTVTEFSVATRLSKPTIYRMMQTGKLRFAHLRVAGVADIGVPSLALTSDGTPEGRGRSACLGDSGGPNFFGADDGETNIIAGTTITGDTQCVATNVIERMDTADSRAFLGQYVTLP